jgi:DNA-binding NarL/FixJ family response regulator
VERTALERFIGRLYAEAATAVREGRESPAPLDEFVADERPAAVDRAISEVAETQLGLNLTPQMLRVLRLVAEGMSNIEIADELSLEISTIKSHVSRLLSRLNVPTRERLIAFAWRYGLVPRAPAEGPVRPGLPPKTQSKDR